MEKRVPTGGRSLGQDKELHASMQCALKSVGGPGKEVRVGKLGQETKPERKREKSDSGS